MEVANGGHPGSFPIEDFTAEQPRMKALFDEFDAKVDAVPVTAADRPAADVFGEFRRLSDAADAALAAVAATGDQAGFDTAIVERHRAFDAGSVLRDLAAAGITCNAR